MDSCIVLESERKQKQHEKVIKLVMITAFMHNLSFPFDIFAAISILPAVKLQPRSFLVFAFRNTALA